MINSKAVVCSEVSRSLAPGRWRRRDAKGESRHAGVSSSLGGDTRQGWESDCPFFCDCRTSMVLRLLCSVYFMINWGSSPPRIVRIVFPMRVVQLHVIQLSHRMWKAGGGEQHDANHCSSGHWMQLKGRAALDFSNPTYHNKLWYLRFQSMSFSLEYGYKLALSALHALIFQYMKHIFIAAESLILANLPQNRCSSEMSQDTKLERIFCCVYVTK